MEFTGRNRRAADVSTTRLFVGLLASLGDSDPLLDHVRIAVGDDEALSAALLRAADDGEVEVWQEPGYAPQVVLTPLGATRAGLVLSGDSSKWESVGFEAKPPPVAPGSAEDEVEVLLLIPDHRAVDPTDLILDRPDRERFVNGHPVPTKVKLWGYARVWDARDVSVASRPRKASHLCRCLGVDLDWDEVCAVCNRGGMDDLLPPATEPETKRVYAPDTTGLMGGKE